MAGEPELEEDEEEDELDELEALFDSPSPEARSLAPVMRAHPKKHAHESTISALRAQERDIRSTIASEDRRCRHLNTTELRSRRWSEVALTTRLEVTCTLGVRKMKSILLVP